MRFKNKVVKIVALVLIISSLAVCFSISASADELSDLRKQLQTLEEEAKKIQSQKNAIKSDKSKQEAYRNSIQSQINNTLAQIENYNKTIATIEGKIAKANADILAKENEMEDLKEEFRTRIRTICMNGGSGEALLTALLSDEDFGNLLTVAEYTKNMSTYDAKLMRDIEKEVEELNALKDNYNSELAEVEALKNTLTEKQKSLANQVSEINSVISSLGGKEQSLNNQYAALIAKERQVEEQIQRLASAGTGSTFNGTFKWPLPGTRSNYTLTSRINMNRVHPVYGYVSPHTGNDYWCSGISGKPIYAAAAGTVTIASFDSGGFGYYVMINHGKYGGAEYATLYAHMTRYIVSKGQKVNQGQIIGYVGSTGAATGPHLHLEVRINGIPKDSELYIK